MNKDAEHAGLLKTNLSEEVVETEWEEFSKDEDNNSDDIDDFIDAMRAKYPDYVFIWVVLDGIITP